MKAKKVIGYVRVSRTMGREGDSLIPDAGSVVEHRGRAWVVSDRVLPREFEDVLVLLREPQPREAD